MKKLAKVLLGAVMLSALFVGCNNGGLVANDVIDAPEVRAEVTKNGVIVLKWDDVKDASDYNLYAMEPGQKEWSKVGFWDNGTSAMNYKVTSPWSYNVYKNEADYKFKLVANSGKANVLAADTEITVTTPEGAFADVAAPTADSIKFTKVSGALNKFMVQFPVNSGYKYNVKLVNATSESGVVLWNNSNNLTSSTSEWGSNFDGAAYNLEYKEDSEGNEVAVDPIVTQFTLGTSQVPYYAVIQAKPKNNTYGTTKYVVSSASVSYDFSADRPNVNVSGVAVKQINTSLAELTFTAGRVNNAYLDGSRFAIYRKATSNVVENGAPVSGATNNSAIVKVGTATKGERVNSVGAPVYYFKDDTVKFEKNVGWTYTYYVVVEYEADRAYNDAEANAWWSDGVSFTMTGAVATDGFTPYVTLSIAHPENTASADVYVNVTNTTTAAPSWTVNYGEFDTLDAAKKAVDSDLTKTLTATLVAGNTAKVANGSSTTTNGVKTNTGYTGTSTLQYKGTLPLASGTTYSSVTTGSVNVTTQTTTDPYATAEKYYVLKVTQTIDGVTDYDYKIVYLDTTTYGTTTTYTVVSTPLVAY